MHALCIYCILAKHKVFDTEKLSQAEGGGGEGGGKRRGGVSDGGGLAVEEAFDYQQQGCSNVFMSVTHKWSSTADKIGLGGNSI